MSYVVQNDVEGVTTYFDYGFYGMVIYLLLMILSIVLAPVSVVPLIPLASSLWGWKLAGILNIIGWTIGAVIAFLLARHYGVPLVSKFLPMKQIYSFEKLIPEEHIFWSVVFLRMVVPVDGLSYFLGLFSKMKLKSFTLATIIGITPFSFILAYVGTISFQYQILFLNFALTFLLIGLLIFFYRKKMKETRRKSN
ncbi:MAG: VTT domain-containing protein [Candidatus Pacearchaeota archaeon]